MVVQKSETVGLTSANDIVFARQAARKWATELGFRLVDQTKIVTATSELARNTVDYGGGGTMRLEEVVDGMKRGLRLIFEDHGPGIPDLDLALKDGYTTGGGMGLGLSGSRRLMDDLTIVSEVGKGTQITTIRWK